MTHSLTQYRTPEVRPPARPFDATLGDRMLGPSLFTSRSAEFQRVIKVARQRAAERGVRQVTRIQRTSRLGLRYWIVQDR